MRLAVSTLRRHKREMSDLPKTDARWPVVNPNVIQLFSMATPNGIKVGVILEELELQYEAHLVHIGQGDQHTEEFRAISPNSKIPILIDPQGPDGKPLTVMESGAILWYLSSKTGRLLPSDPREQIECLQWLCFQVGHIGPIFGQFGHFHKFAHEQCDHPYPVERYRAESERLLSVLNQRLVGRDYVLGSQYTIADIAIFPWVGALLNFYQAAELVHFSNYDRVARWYERCVARPAVQRGVKVCAP